MGKGNMIGEEDAVVMRNYTTTVRCVTYEGELLAIKTIDFYQRVKTNDDSWYYIKKTSKQKEQNVIHTINKSNYIIKTNK